MSGPAATPTPEKPRGMRRVVFVAPSAFTLGNLFFGFWSIVSSSRDNFAWAGWAIVLAGVLDGLDGRVARLSKTSSRFGAELDSLVDVISFGVAPALLMYHLEFADGGNFTWVICYLYVVAAALRLARFNVSVGAGTPGMFTGLPSPAAGGTLAVFYPFSQTEVYHQIAAALDLNGRLLGVLVILIAVLMVSSVKYPKSPKIGFSSLKGILGSLVWIGIFVGIIVAPASFMFPVALAYIAYGVLRTVFLSLLDRPDREALQAIAGSREEDSTP